MGGNVLPAPAACVRTSIGHPKRPGSAGDSSSWKSRRRSRLMSSFPFRDPRSRRTVPPIEAAPSNRVERTGLAVLRPDPASVPAGAA
jgi:hypothetical protein